MASELFDFINNMFSNRSQFEKTTLYERGRHFFMINRFMAIKHPMAAQYLNNTKISPGNAVTYWADSVGRQHSRTPSWMYVKTKAAKEKKAAEKPVSDQTIRYYCQRNQCSVKDVENAITLLGEPFLEELRDLQRLIEKS
jgi:hypothetical protein